jgi:hypothetical protein
MDTVLVQVYQRNDKADLLHEHLPKLQILSIRDFLFAHLVLAAIKQGDHAAKNE